MAKLRPNRPLAEMEKEVGFKLEASTGVDEVAERLYSNLRPARGGLYERTEKKHEEFVKRKHRPDRQMRKDGILPTPGKAVVSCLVYTSLSGPWFGALIHVVNRRSRMVAIVSDWHV